MERLYKDKIVSVIGLGKSGLSCVDYLLKCGAKVQAIDNRSADQLKLNLPQQVDTYFAHIPQDVLLKSDLIVVSPGVAVARPEIQVALKQGISVVGDIELFCRVVQEPIIAITGSNGKSTVTTLVYEMARAASLNVGLGGNIGIPVLSLLEKKYDLYVLELSSFQLETTYSLQAKAATVLNVSADHLNRYSGVDAYKKAKLRIYENAENCIVNQQDSNTLPLQANRIISFGFSGDYYLEQEGERTWLVAQGEKVLATDELGIVGQHNELNALAALALADAADIPRQGSIKALKNFKGLEHRFQLVAQYDGVSWINDSKATNIGSTQAALNGLNIDGTIHLLLGGQGKGADFMALKSSLSANNIMPYCFGQDRELFLSVSPRVELFSTMEEAIAVIKTRVKSGDVVLLSPACASFDQFNGFEHRGEVFTQLAQMS